MSEIRQGQVYWLDFGPRASSAPAERHACVVVQNDIFNQSAIATNLSRANAPGNVLLKKGEANLPKASVVNISQILTVDKTELAEYVGKLSSTAASAVSDGLHLLFDRL